MANDNLKRTMLEVVDNQLKDGNPKITSETLVRLIKAGHSEKTSKEMIAAVLLEQMYDVLKYKKPFDEELYAQKLEQMVTSINENSRGENNK